MDYQETLTGYINVINRAIANTIGSDDEAIAVSQLVMAGVGTLSLMADFDMLEKEA